MPNLALQDMRQLVKPPGERRKRPKQPCSRDMTITSEEANPYWLRLSLISYNDKATQRMAVQLTAAALNSLLSCVRERTNRFCCHHVMHCIINSVAYAPTNSQCNALAQIVFLYILCVSRLVAYGRPIVHLFPLSRHCPFSQPL